MDLINNTVSAVGKGGARVGRLGVNAVHMAGGGVVKTASIAGHAVGKTAKRAASTGVTAASTVGGVAKASATTVATMGVTAVTTAGDAVGKTAGVVGKTAVTAGNVGRSLVTKTSSNGSRRSAGVSTLSTSMDIFCSDFYTEQFVLDEIEKVRQNNKIVSLNFEDLIQRQSPQLSKAVTQFILDTAASTQELMDDQSEQDMDTSWRNASKRRNVIKRNWNEICFTEAISDASDYQAFLAQKEAFHAKINSASNFMTTKVPMKFKAKIELHTMMTVEEVLELLQEIEKDTSITDVDFPIYPRDHSKVPDMFAENFNLDTMTWKESASPIEIHLRYGEQDLALVEEEGEDAFSELNKETPPTFVIQHCRCLLDKSPPPNKPTRNNVLDESFSWSDDNVLLQEEGIVPGPAQRASTGMRTPRTALPHKSNKGLAPGRVRSEGSRARSLSPKKGASIKKTSKDGKPRQYSDDSQVKRRSGIKQISPKSSPVASPKRSSDVVSPKRPSAGIPTTMLPTDEAQEIKRRSGRDLEKRPSKNSARVKA